MSTSSGYDLFGTHTSHDNKATRCGGGKSLEDAPPRQRHVNIQGGCPSKDGPRELEDGPIYVYICVVCKCVCEKGEERLQRQQQDEEDADTAREMGGWGDAAPRRPGDAPHTEKPNT
ncbi:hypothetical protein Hdeb2414_s0003g00085681 [Helianthus debilis subsp. tardiflorus]